MRSALEYARLWQVTCLHISVQACGSQCNQLNDLVTNKIFIYIHIETTGVAKQ